MEHNSQQMNEEIDLLKLLSLMISKVKSGFSSIKSFFIFNLKNIHLNLFLFISALSISWVILTFLIPSTFTGKLVVNSKYIQNNYIFYVIDGLESNIKEDNLNSLKKLGFVNTFDNIKSISYEIDENTPDSLVNLTPFVINIQSDTGFLLPLIQEELLQFLEENEYLSNNFNKTISYKKKRIRDLEMALEMIDSVQTSNIKIERLNSRIAMPIFDETTIISKKIELANQKSKLEEDIVELNNFEVISSIHSHSKPDLTTTKLTVITFIILYLLLIPSFYRKRSNFKWIIV